jgi:hypothetical protein
MIGDGNQATAAKVRNREEEEEMTRYVDDDPLAEWEFKIIRSGTG